MPGGRFNWPDSFQQYDVNGSKQQSEDASPTQTTSQNVDYRKYTILDSGVNEQGNHYCTRAYHGRGATDDMIGYHYLNTDGSYYYSNPDGTTYYNNGRGGSRYTRADGSGWNKQQFAAPDTGSKTRATADQDQMYTSPSSGTSTIKKEKPWRQ